MAQSMTLFQEAVRTASDITWETFPARADGRGCLQCDQPSGSDFIERTYNPTSYFDQGTTCPDCKGGRTVADCLTCSGTGVVCAAYGYGLTRRASDYTNHVSWETCPDCGGHPKTVLECKTCNGSGVVGSTTDNAHCHGLSLAGSYAML